MKLLVLSALILLPSRKHVVEKYEGGSPYHSHLIVTLFSDSTFTYSTWYHSSPKETNVYRGTWRKTSNRLVLNSLKPNSIFRNNSYEIKSDTLKLFSKEDSIKNYRFYKEYFSLVRKP